MCVLPCKVYLSFVCHWGVLWLTIGVLCNIIAEHNKLRVTRIIAWKDSCYFFSCHHYICVTIPLSIWHHLSCCYCILRPISARTCWAMGVACGSDMCHQRRCPHAITLAHIRTVCYHYHLFMLPLSFIFMSLIVLYFLHSTSVLSFHIDVVLTLSIITWSVISFLKKTKRHLIGHTYITNMV